MVRLTNHPNMTIAVDWDVKNQTKQNQQKHHEILSHEEDFKNSSKIEHTVYKTHNKDSLKPTFLKNSTRSPGL